MRHPLVRPVVRLAKLPRAAEATAPTGRHLCGHRGAVGIITGALAESLAIMMIGQAIAGVAFGAAFTASLHLILPLAPV